MKLSDLKPNQIEPVSVPQSSGLKLSNLDPNSIEQAEDYSPLESAGLGAAQGASLNFEAPIEGGARALYKKASGEQGDLKELYDKYRDIANKRNQDAQTAHPNYFMAGQLAGGIAPLAAGGAGLGALGLKAASVGGAAALGAASGGLGSVGQDVSQGQDINVGNATKDAAIGGALGGATQGIANKLLNPEALENSASISAIKGLGGKPYAGRSIAGSSDFGTNLGVGKTVLEQDALPLFGGAEATQDALQNANNTLQAKNAPISANAAQEIFQNPSITDGKINIAPKVEQAMYDQISNLPGDQSGIDLGQSIEKNLQPLLAKLDATGNDPQLLESVKQEFQAIAKREGAYNGNPDASSKAKIYSNLAGIVNDDVKNLIEMATPGTDYGATNKSLSDIIKAQSLVEKPGGILSQDLNNAPGSMGLFGKGTVGAGATALAFGHPVVGATAIATGVAKSIAENASGTPIGRFANILAAKGKYALSQNAPAAQQVTGMLGRTGVQAGLSTYMASPEHLKQVADNFEQNDTTKNLGVALNKALTSGDQNSIRGVTFAIEQNPYSRLQARQLLANMQGNNNGQ